MLMKRYFITGGCGFIGSNFINHLIENKLADPIINLDKMTYAGNIENLNAIEKQNYHFIKEIFGSKTIVRDILKK